MRLLIRSILPIILAINTFILLAQLPDDEKIILANNYFNNGETEKAKILFEELKKNPKNHILISKNYINLLKTTNDFKKVELFLKSVLKKNPDNINFNSELLLYYHEQNLKKDYERSIGNIIEKNSKNEKYLAQYATVFKEKNLYQLSIDFYKKCRELNNNFLSYSLEMATLYSSLDKKNLMYKEYINYAVQSEFNMYNVKNILQRILHKNEEELDYFENLLLERIQKRPDIIVLSELLLWIALQKKDFYNAFIQARAIDKRENTIGRKVMYVASVAMENEKYEEAMRAYKYAYETYRNTHNYYTAKKNYLLAKEKKLTRELTIDTLELRNLARDYYAMYLEFNAVNNVSFELLRKKAFLHSFYLDEMDSAIYFLSKIINNPKTESKVKAESKIDLADMYIIKNEPWEASLLYSQVEKDFKDHEIAHLAKLKNAKMSYYIGHFKLSMGHLNILKRNTSRKISNDAIFLAGLIHNNTILDTSDFIMKKYARVELLFFQNKIQAAKDTLYHMLEDYPGHSIEDEILWLLASIELKTGDVKKAIESLNKIISNFANDILADDATFKVGDIYQNILKDENMAKEIFKNFLIKYQGSRLISEARKRYRALRGDNVN